MRVLDCGCGPGSITLGLAKAVAPGEVVGVDPLANRLAMARAAADAQGIENVRFEQGDIHTLPFADGTFDAALVHAVMEHITEPVDAMAEVRRVLKTGGVVGVRSPMHTAALRWPNPEAQRYFSIFVRLWAARGANFEIAPSLRGTLRAAGFSRVVGSASVESKGTADETRLFAQEMQESLDIPAVREALERGFTTSADVERARSAWLAWGEHPDAFIAVTWCEGLGWAD
jgi:SAM-dependent methyltransferase